jgi:hypothetical protein
VGIISGLFGAFEAGGGTGAAVGVLGYAFADSTAIDFSLRSAWFGACWAFFSSTFAGLLASNALMCLPFCAKSLPPESASSDTFHDIPDFEGMVTLLPSRWADVGTRI